MPKRVFISFNFKDRNYRDNLTNFFQRNLGPVQATPHYVTKDVSAEGPGAVRAECDAQIQLCVGMICLVGDDAHNSPWIDYELASADRFRIPRIFVQHPQSRGGIPNRFIGNAQIIPWDGTLIADKVARW